MGGATCATEQLIFENEVNKWQVLTQTVPKSGTG